MLPCEEIKKAHQSFTNEFEKTQYFIVEIANQVLWEVRNLFDQGLQQGLQLFL